MSAIEVELPDGTVVEFPEGTDNATMERALAGYAATRADFSGVSGASDTVPAEEPPGLGRQVGLGARAMMRGAYSLPGLVLDPVMAATGQPTSQQAADLHADKLGLPRPEYATERVSGDITSALTGGGGFIAAGRQLAARAPGVVQGVGEMMSATPGAQVAGLTAAPAAAGIARESGATPGQQATAGLIAGLGAPLSMAGTAAATRGAIRGGETGRQQMQDNIAAYRGVGAQPSVGQAAGNARMQGAENLLAGAPTSTSRMTAFAERQAQDIGQGLRQRADDFVPNASAEKAGRAVEKGAETFGNNVNAMRRALYWQADQQIPETVRVPLSNTQQALTRLTALTPGAESTTATMVNPKIAQMARTVQEDLFAARAQGAGGIPYSAVKDLRSRIGAELSDYSLTTDKPTAQYKALYAALSRDMEEAARAQGAEAVRAVKRANNYFKASADRLTTLERAVDRNGGPEKVYSAVMAGTRDGGTTLRSVLQSLPKESQRSLTAAVIKRMGLANPGQQDAEGAVFSAQTFLTNWNKVSPEARRALFDRHGPQFARNMDKIAKVAESIRDGSRVFANPSGTANRAAAYTYGVGLAGAAANTAITGSTGPLVILVGGGVAANVAARVLTNPRFVNWLAESTNVPMAALPQQVVALKAIAEEEGDPEIAEFAAALEEQPGN